MTNNYLKFLDIINEEGAEEEPSEDDIALAAYFRKLSDSEKRSKEILKKSNKGKKEKQPSDRESGESTKDLEGPQTKQNKEIDKDVKTPGDGEYGEPDKRSALKTLNDRKQSVAKPEEFKEKNKIKIPDRVPPKTLKSRSPVQRLKDMEASRKDAAEQLRKIARSGIEYAASYQLRSRGV